MTLELVRVHIVRDLRNILQCLPTDQPDVADAGLRDAHHHQIELLATGCELARLLLIGLERGVSAGRGKVADLVDTPDVGAIEKQRQIVHQLAAVDVASLLVQLQIVQSLLRGALLRRIHEAQQGAARRRTVEGIVRSRRRRVLHPKIVQQSALRRKSERQQAEKKQSKFP